MENQTSHSPTLKEIALDGIRQDIEEMAKKDGFEEALNSDLRFAVESGASIEEIFTAMLESIPEQIRPEIYADLVHAGRIPEEELEMIRKLWNLE